MRKNFLRILIGILYLYITSFGFAETNLTVEEQRWIQKNPKIRVHNEENWAPFNFNEEEVPKGISIDFMNLAAKKVGLQVEYVTGPTWNEFMEMLKKGEIDVMLNIIKTEERKGYLAFTRTYAKNPNVIVVMEDMEYETLEELSGKTVAVPRGFHQEKLLEKYYPDIDLYLTDDLLGAIKAVSYGKADASLGGLSAVTHLIKENFIPGTRISGELEFKEKEYQEYHFATKKENDILRSVLDKGLARITDEERNEIIINWGLLESGRKVGLTPEEKKWIEENPIIRVENEGNWAPFNFNEDGVPKGFAVDFMNLVSERVGLKIEYITGPTWEELMEMARIGEIDVLLGVAKTPKRKKNFGYTESFAVNPTIILSSLGEEYKSLEELEGKTVSIPKGYYQEEILRKEHPKINLYLTDDSLESIKAVVFGQVDATLGDLAIVNYLVRKNFISGVVVSGEVKFQDETLSNLHMATQIENEILRSILDKGIASVTPKEKVELTNEWLAPLEGVGQGLTLEEKEWLKKNNKFRLGIHRSWAPFSFLNSKGEFAGEVSDYVKIIVEKLEIEMIPQEKIEWNDTLQGIKDGEIDIIVGVEKTNNPQEDIILTDSYITVPMVIATRDGSKRVRGIEALWDKKIAVVSGSLVHKYIEKNYPEYELVLYGDIVKAMKAVASGKAFAIIANINSINYIIEKYSLDNIKIASTTDYTIEVAMGVSKKYPELVPILNKVLYSIGENEKSLLKNKWIEIPIEKEFNWHLFWKGTLLLLTIFVCMIIWNRKLASEIRIRKEMEEKILASEEQSRLLLESASEGIFGVDKEGKTTFINPSALEQLGYLKEEMIGEKIHGLIHYAHYDCSDYPLEQCPMYVSYTYGKPSKVISEVLWRKDGTTLDVEYTSTPMLKGTELVGAVIMFKDITKKLKVEKELKLSYFGMDNAADSILWLHPDNGKIVRCNKTSWEELGYTKEEFEKVSFSNITPSFSLDKWTKLVKKLKVGEVINFEIDHRRKDGRLIPVEVTVKHLEYGGEEYIVAFTRNISERKEAEKKVIETIETANKIIENSPVPIAVIDMETKDIIRVNKSMEKFNGISHKELNKYKAYDMYADMEKDKSEILNKIESGEVIENYEVQSRKLSTGEKKWVLFSSHSIKYIDRNAIIITVIDIDDIKNIQGELEVAKEKAEEATKAKSDFLANMSHEIRTPMNAILGLNGLLKKTELSNKQKDYVEKVSRSATNLLGIINDILDFSKIEAGKMDVELVKFKLDNVLEGLSNVSSLKAAEKGIEFVIEKNSKVSEWYVGDPLRIGQVLLNLTNNAIKFTETGEVLVKISLKEIDGEKTELKFEVKDTGVGLKDAQRKKLFSAFTQADASTTRKYGGTGLGLSISKHLVNLMGGSIGVESEYGKGSNFFFTLPLEVKDVKKEVVSKEMESLKNLKVMVVDDNESARRVMGEYLKDFSFDTIFATSGEEAISKYEATVKEGNAIDLILMDLKMNGIDGIEAWNIIKDKVGPKEKLPKVILVTAYGREDILERAKKEEIETVLMKPLSQSLLFDDIMETFGVERKIFTHKKIGKEFPEGFDEIRGAKILVAEDNLINQDVIKAILEEEGFEVYIEGNGQKILEALESIKDFDVVLMDLQMPIMDGYEASSKIRTIEEYKELPIIALSADAMSGTKGRVGKSGMNGYVTKPIDKYYLYETLVKWIKPGKREIFKEGKEENEDGLQMKLKELVRNIDVEEGLKRVGGKTDLYIDILKRFITTNRKFIEHFRDDLINPSKLDKIRAAHTLKGVAGNIGAKKIYKISRELEVKIKSGENLDKILNDLHAELQKVAVEVDMFLVEVENRRESIEKNVRLKEQKEIDLGVLEKNLSILKGLLEGYDTESEEVFLKVKKQLGGMNLDIILKRLEKSIDNYDFEEAINSLENLKVEIGRLKE